MVSVLLSGGIDSLVAAYLLKQSYPRVSGIYLRTGYNDLSDRDVRAVSDRVDIPVEVIDCRREFKAGVVDYFTRSYLAGETPNPCLRCNPHIKFRIGLAHALNRGADFVASGHYCRTDASSPGGQLLKGVDPAKDQSYFLAFLSPEQLARIRFPVGHMTKKAVIALAGELGLAPVRSGESQDVCFIRPQESYGDFIARQIDPPPGPGIIEDLDGNVIGRHDGVHLFTVGQRRGINCPAAAPYYVAAIDVEQNRIRVGFRADLLTAHCRLREVNRISPLPADDFSCAVKVRYQHHAIPARVTLLPDDRAGITFDRPQFGVAPGQGAVFYQGDTVLGGGIICG
jgi:tRNA-specific 2-thiouridylase